MTTHIHMLASNFSITKRKNERKENHQSFSGTSKMHELTPMKHEHRLGHQTRHSH